MEKQQSKCKCMKHYDKNRELSYLKYWDVSNLYGWVMAQNLSVNDIRWVEDIFEFNEDFVDKMMIKLMKDIFLKLMFNILKIYITFRMIYSFLLERTKKSESL